MPLVLEVTGSVVFRGFDRYVGIVLKTIYFSVDVVKLFGNVLTVDGPFRSVSVGRFLREAGFVNRSFSLVGGCAFGVCVGRRTRVIGHVVA